MYHTVNINNLHVKTTPTSPHRRDMEGRDGGEVERAEWKIVLVKIDVNCLESFLV